MLFVAVSIGIYRDLWFKSDERVDTYPLSYRI